MANTYGTADNSFDAGYLDGELAAITQLPSRRAHARISMAEQYDPMYAAGYGDGYLHTIAVNAALREAAQNQLINTRGDTQS